MNDQWFQSCPLKVGRTTIPFHGAPAIHGLGMEPLCAVTRLFPSLSVVHSPKEEPNTIHKGQRSVPEQPTNRPTDRSYPLHRSKCKGDHIALQPPDTSWRTSLSCPGLLDSSRGSQAGIVPAANVWGGPAPEFRRLMHTSSTYMYIHGFCFFILACLHPCIYTCMHISHPFQGWRGTLFPAFELRS